MNALHQQINLFSSIIQGKRGSRGGWHTETLHRRHRTVMARTHRHPFLIQDRTDVVSMNVIKDKRHDAGFFFRGT